MIISFSDPDAERIFNEEEPRKLRLSEAMLRKALIKLRAIHLAQTLYDFYDPPSNRFEALSGDRKGQYSIRINVRWRICLRFENDNAYDVEIVDYH